MNKYQEIMDKVQVTDDMKARILQNIDNNVNSSAGNNIYALPTPKKSSKVVSFLKTASVAAAFVLVAVGSFAVFNSGILNKNNATADSAMESMMVAEADVQTEGAVETGANADDPNVISTYGTANSMSNITGIGVNDIDELLDEAEDSSYALLEGNTAQIQYKMSDDTVTIRKQQDEQTEKESAEEQPTSPRIVAGGKENEEKSEAAPDAKNAFKKESADSPVIEESSYVVGENGEYSHSENVNINGVSVTIYGDETKFYYASWNDDGYNLDLQTEKGMSQEEFVELLSKVVGFE